MNCKATDVMERYNYNWLILRKLWFEQVQTFCDCFSGKITLRIIHDRDCVEEKIDLLVLPDLAKL